MKIKVTIQIDEDSFEFDRAVEEIKAGDDELTGREIKDLIHDELLDTIQDWELSEMLPDWADLFLTRR